MKWVTNSIDKTRSLKDHYKLHSIDIIIKDPLPEYIDMDFVVKYVSLRIPSFFLKGVDVIYVGQFNSLIQKQVNALYEDGAIYITNEQNDDADMIDDLIHELAHSVEENFTEMIYSDGMLEIEFLKKRRLLQASLLHAKQKTPPLQFLVTSAYDQEIDDYLYKDIGYTALWSYVVGIFPSPYAATSLREYFARGFEEFYMGEKKSLTKNNSVLYSKLQELADLED